MKNANRLLLGAVAVALAFALTGCSFRDMVASVVKKFVSTSSSEEDAEINNRVYGEVGGSVTFPESAEFNTSNRYATLVQDGNLYISFNGIKTYTTGYFHISGSSLTVSSYATTESTGSLNYKFALWKLADDGSSMVYVPDSTVYFTPDGSTRTATVTGLDPNSQYKVSISYDSGSFYVSGGFQIGGVSAEAPAQDPEEGSGS